MVSIVDLLLKNFYLIMEMEHLVGPCESGLWHLPCSGSVTALTWYRPESCVYLANDGDAMPGLLRVTEEFKLMTTHK